MFLHLDAATEAGVVIAGKHRHGSLHKNSAAIDGFIDQVGGATGQGDPGGQGLAHPIEALETGQQ